jgi:hypothetical protein
MDELDLASALIAESETVVSYPVKTQGSGDHEAPVILLTDLDASRVQRGNSSQDGLVTDDSGTVVGERLEHKYKASSVIEARSATETESYTLASNLRDHFAVFEEYEDQLHNDVIEVYIGKVKQTDPVVETPEPLYKHYFSLSVKYTHTVTRQIENDTSSDSSGTAVQELTSVEDDITLS